MPDEPEKKEEVKERFVVGEVATQTAPVIIDNKTGTSMTQEQSNALILNTLEDMKKKIVG